MAAHFIDPCDDMLDALAHARNPGEPSPFDSDEPDGEFDSIAIGRICEALKRGDLTSDTLLRMCVRSVYESGGDHEMRLWDELVRFAEAK